MNKQSSLRTVLNSTSSRLTISAAVVLLSASQGFSQSYTIVDLGTLGGEFSTAHDINDAGQIVGASVDKENSGYSQTGFLWENGVMIAIGSIYEEDPSLGSSARGINSLGVLCGTGGNPDNQNSAFRWEKGLITVLPTLGGNSIGKKINDLGDIAGSSRPIGSGTYHATLWIGNEIIDIGNLYPGENSLARDVNNSRDVVCTSGAPNANESIAFLWRNEIKYVLPSLTGKEVSGHADAINETGYIAGFSRAPIGDYHPVLWDIKDADNISIIDLGVPDGFSIGISTGLNDIGQIIGVYYGICVPMGPDCYQPFVWKDGQIHLLDEFPDWDLDSAVAINNVGQIVGTGFAPNGEQHGYLLNPIIPGDLDGDFTVSTSDLLILLSSWGSCSECDDCPADLDDNCEVGTSDLLILLSNWS